MSCRIQHFLMNSMGSRFVHLKRIAYWIRQHKYKVNDLFILHSQYDGNWWPGEARTSTISAFIYSSPSITRFNIDCYGMYVVLPGRMISWSHDSTSDECDKEHVTWPVCYFCSFQKAQYMAIYAYGPYPWLHYKWAIVKSQFPTFVSAYQILSCRILKPYVNF